MNGLKTLDTIVKYGEGGKVFSRRDFIIGSAVGLLSSGVEAGIIENFESQGNIRKITIRGANLDQIHGIAANNFTKKLESDFKNKDTYYGVQNFHTEVNRVGNEYEFVYSLELVPVSKTKPHFRVVQIMGTVYHHRDAKKKVEEINARKIPQLQQSISQKYSGMQYLVAVSKQSDIYHQAVLGVGTSK